MSEWHFYIQEDVSLELWKDIDADIELTATDSPSLLRACCSWLSLQAAQL